MGIGIDIVELKRISVEEKFIDLVLSNKEKEIMSQRVNKVEYLGSRWAAKEAFLKANHVGLGKIKLKEIIVLNNEDGSPYILYNGKIYSEISISHEKEYAVAVVRI